MIHHLGDADLLFQEFQPQFPVAASGGEVTGIPIQTPTLSSSVSWIAPMSKILTKASLETQHAEPSDKAGTRLPTLQHGQHG